MTRRPSLFPALLRHPATLLVAAFALSCIGDTSGPSAGVPARFQLAPYFQDDIPPGLIPVGSVRIVLTRPGPPPVVALDTTVIVPTGATELDLSLTVPVFTAADTFSATIDMLSPGGVVVFHGGPITVVGHPSEGSGAPPPPPPVEIALTWVGPGSETAILEIVTSPVPGVITGDTVVLTAVAKKSDGTVVAAPIGWVSLDPLRASIPNIFQGRVVGGTQRGLARIAAVLPGLADTALVPVQLLPAAIGVVSGGGQSATVHSLLSQPLVAVVKASDSVPVTGVWVKFQVTAGGGTVSPDSGLTDNNGRAQTQLTLGPTAGPQSVKATTPKVAGLQTTFANTALAGAAASIAVSAGQDQTVTVGTAVTVLPAVEVRDVDNNLVPAAAVTFAVASGGGQITGASQTTDASGVARVGGWILGTIAGTNTLTATIPGGAVAPPDVMPAAAATGVTFTATGSPGATTQLVLSGLPASQTAGAFSSPTVTAKDQYGNMTPGYTGTIAFLSTDGQATVPDNYTFVAGDAGVKTFTNGVTLKTAGSKSVKVSDAGTPSIFSIQNVSVGPAGASTLIVSGIPASAPSGVAQSVTVTAKDPFTNVATGYLGTIHFISSDGAASLPADYTFTGGDAGAHTFTGGVTLLSNGSQSVTATDVAAPSITGSQSVTVTGGGGTVATFAFAGLPGTVTANDSQTVTVTAKDGSGATVTTYTGTVYFTSSDPLASYPVPYTFVPADNGVHTFTDGFAFRMAGSRTVTATDQADPAITGASAAVTVNPTTIAAFIVTGTGDSVVGGVVHTRAGVPISVQVAAKDTFYNTITDYAGTVHFSATDPANPIVPPDYTFVPADLGVRDFPGSVTLFTAGTQAVLVLDQNDVGGGLPVEVEAVAGPVQSLVFTTAPPNQMEGEILSSVQVTARDASNNVATGFTGNILVSIASNPSGGTLGGTRTVAAVAGVATFDDLSIDKYGSNYTLAAVTSGISPATSAAFTITPVGMTAHWTGAVSSDVTDGNNWVGGVPPTDVDNVFVPVSAPNYPVVAETGLINDLIIEQGATFNMSGFPLTVTGNLAAGNTIVAADVVTLTGVGKTVSGHMPKLTITGSYTATDSVKVDTDLAISGLGANLTLDGHRVKVGGNFATQDAATFTMTNPADTLDVGLQTMFAGGNTGGLLTNGLILARGDFIQVGHDNAGTTSDTVETFKATGAHRVELVGTSAQGVGLGTAPVPPGCGGECFPPYFGGSQFGHLKVLNPNGVTVSGTVVALGDFESPTSGAVTGDGQRVAAGGIVSIGGDVTLSILSAGGNLSIAGNATLSSLQVGGLLDFTGTTYSVAATTFTGDNPTIPITLPYEGLAIVGSGTANISGPLNPTGTLVIGGTVQFALAGTTSAASIDVRDGAHLNLNGQTLATPGIFQVRHTATFQMNNASDLLQIGSHAYFLGESTAGLLTDGTIELAGRFENQFPTSPLAFSASGNHKVILNGTGPGQALRASSGVTLPGTPMFQALEVQNSSGVALEGTITVLGDLTSTPGGPITIWSGGPTLVVAGNLSAPSIDIPEVRVGGVLGVTGTYNVATTVFTGTGQTIPFRYYPLMVVTGSASLEFIESFNTGAVRVDAGGSLNLAGNDLRVDGNVSVAGTMTGPGELQMTGTSTTLKGALNARLHVLDAVSLDSTVQVNGTVHVEQGNLTLNGYQLTATDSLWTSSGGTLTMTNSADMLTANNVLIQGGNTLGLLTAGELRILGNFEEAGVAPDTNAYAPTGAHTTVFKGSGTQTVTFTNVTTASSGLVKSQFNNLRFENGADVQFTSVWTEGNAVIAGFANLAIGGAQVSTIVGDLETQGSGTLTMTATGGQLNVDGDAIFAGASTEGKLTNGTLRVAGHFSQAGDPKAFAATGTNTVMFTGSTPHTVSFADPGAALSHFRHITIDVGTGVVTLGSNAHATGGARVERGRLQVNAKQFTVDSALRVGVSSIEPATLDFGAPDGQKSMIRVLGNLDMGGETYFSMHELNDSLVVSGDASFFDNQPADTALTSGVIVFGKGFDEDGSPGLNINASGNTKVVAVGAGGGTGVTFWFASGAFRHFEVADTGKVQFGYSGTVISGNLTVDGSGEFDGNFATIQGDATVSSSGVFDPNGSTVEGNFSTSGTGVLRMQSGAGFTVIGNATFGGGSSTGLLTDGTFELRGNFLQAGDATAFQASGSHVTKFNAPAGQSVSFTTPGPDIGGSHFNHVIIEPTADVTLQSPLFVNQQLLASGTGPDTSRVIGVGHFMHVAETQVSALILERVRFSIEDPTGVIQTFNNVRFANYLDDDIMLDVQHPGPGPLQFNGLNFENHTAGTGKYIKATDTDGGTGALTITDVNVDPMNGLSRTQTDGVATVTWLPLTFNVVSAAAPNATTVEVTFDRAPQAAAANTALNYAITEGITVSNASLSGNVVTLTTSTMPAGSHTVTVAGAVVRAIDGQALTNNTATFTSP